MDAIEFVKKLEKKPRKDISKLSTAEYFETDEGRQMISIIAKRVKVVGENTFELSDWGTINSLNINPLYQGRDFMQDMKKLGFKCKIVSQIPVTTYWFELK